MTGSLSQMATAAGMILYLHTVSCRPLLLSAPLPEGRSAPGRRRHPGWPLIDKPERWRIIQRPLGRSMPMLRRTVLFSAALFPALAALPVRAQRPWRIVIIPKLVGIAYYDARTDELDKEIVSMRRKLPRFTAVNSGLESKALVERDQPAVIIASSGMATGGRVVHHLFAGLPDPRNTVLFVGFQAAGTRGRQLVDGAQYVKIFGQHVPVHARIEKIDGMSAHADAGEIVRWLRTFPRAPRTTYLVHGEVVAQDALKARITKELGWNVEIPTHGQKVDLPL